MSKIIKKIKTSSLSTTLVLYFVLLVSAVILLVSIISYRYTINDIEGLSISYTDIIIQELTSHVDSYMQNIKSMCTLINENKDVQALLEVYDKNRGAELSTEMKNEIAQTRKDASAHLDVLAKTRSEIVNIAIISKYHNILLNDVNKSVNPNSEYNVTDWFLNPLSYRDEIKVSPAHVQNIVNGEYNWVISVSKAIISGKTGEVIGVMVIDLNFYAIEAICETANLGKNGYVYIIDEKENLVYHPQQQLMYAGVKKEPSKQILQLTDPYLRTQDNKIYSKHTSDLTRWTTVGVVNSNELIRNKVEIIRFYIILGTICLLISTITAIAISASITKPIKRLEKTMRAVEGGDLSVKANTDTPNEIGHLGKTFNRMVSEIKSLMDATVKAEEEKRKNEIKALQAQINPHFLYNTLDSIIWMAASGKTDEVAEMTAALAKLFRTSISKGSHLVTLKNEIDNITSYLTIQKMRYSDKLTYSIDVDKSFLQIEVPKLILQPIVENSLYHGVKLQEYGGDIHIGALAQRDALVITVSDSGAGMTNEQIEHIFDEKATDSGIGVINVHNRLKLCFGEEYGLSYFSVPEIGTRVEIRLPLSSKEDTNV